MSIHTTAIEVAGLTKSFADNAVLRGIDLSVPAGTVYALLGPNGAGKTTMVRILSTLTTADSGEARVAGFNVRREADGVRRSIGVTGQFSAIDELLTGRENLRLMADLAHLRRHEARARAQELLVRFDLTDAADRRAATYSGDADDEGFARAVAEIDRRLRGEIRELQEHRRRVAQLAAGDSLALPPEVIAYLDRMRELGAAEVMVEMERDAWILIAAQWPEKMSEFMVEKQAQLDDPLMQRFLLSISAGLADDDQLEARLVETADLLAEMAEQAAANGDLDLQDAALPDSAFVDLLDTVALAGGPRLVRLRDRLLELMAERGWTGLAKLERIDGTGAHSA